MLSAERRDSGSTGVHAALLAPSGAVRAAGSTRRRQLPRQRQYGRSRRPLSAVRRRTRRRQYAPLAVRAAGSTYHLGKHIVSQKTSKKCLLKPKIACPKCQNASKCVQEARHALSCPFAYIYTIERKQGLKWPFFEDFCKRYVPNNSLFHILDIQKKHQGHCQFEAFVIMGNHIHLLIKMLGDAVMRDLLQCIKRETTTAIRQLLDLNNDDIWMRGSFPRIVRSPREFEKTLQYKKTPPGGY